MGPVRHDCQNPRVGFAGIASAGTAVEGGLERIVFGSAPVTAEHYQPREVPRQPHQTKHRFHRVHLFGDGESGPRDALHPGKRRALIDSVLRTQLLHEGGLFLLCQRSRAGLGRWFARGFLVEGAPSEKIEPLERGSDCDRRIFPGAPCG